MSDDLVKQLRNSKGWPTLGNAAADRIEELEAKLKSETERLGREVNLARYGQPDFAWSIHVQAMAELEAKLSEAQFERDNNRGKLEIKKRELSVAADRIEELEAKLAKAVEALEEIIEIPTRRYQRKIARRTLAELKGTDK